MLSGARTGSSHPCARQPLENGVNTLNGVPEPVDPWCIARLLAATVGKERPDVVKTFREMIPMGDYGQPEDLGPLALYLASDASRYMTGTTLVIDGGYTCL